MKINLCLITGATSGIGKALSYLLASKKIPLILTGRNEKELNLLRDQLSRQVEIVTYKADLSIDKDRLGLIELLKQRLPDLVINNAGFGLYGDALSHSIEEQLNILDVNGRACLELTLVASKALLDAKKRGIILNVSSAAAFQIFPGMAVYAASKALVNSFSQSLDYELEKNGVRILTACPGFIETGFAKRAAGHPVDPKTAISPMNVEFAANEIWDQIKKTKSLHIFDWKYRLATFLSKLVPKKLSAEIVYKEVMSRKNS